MVPLTLLFAPLELLQTLHNGAVWEALFVFDCRDTTLLRHVLPSCRLVVPILRRIEGEHIAAAIDRVLVVRGVRIGLDRLNNGSARWDQI